MKGQFFLGLGIGLIFAGLGLKFLDVDIKLKDDKNSIKVYEKQVIDEDKIKEQEEINRNIEEMLKVKDDYEDKKLKEKEKQDKKVKEDVYKSIEKEIFDSMEDDKKVEVKEDVEEKIEEKVDEKKELIEEKKEDFEEIKDIEKKENKIDVEDLNEEPKRVRDLNIGTIKTFKDRDYYVEVAVYMDLARAKAFVEKYDNRKFIIKNIRGKYRVVVDGTYNEMEAQEIVESLKTKERLSSYIVEKDIIS